MMISAMKSGVAINRPFCRIQKLPPRMTSVTGMNRATQDPHAAHAAVTTLRSFSSPKSNRTAANNTSTARG
jgi:hypothetical protein